MSTSEQHWQTEAAVFAVRLQMGLHVRIIRRRLFTAKMDHSLHRGLRKSIIRFVLPTRIGYELLPPLPTLMTNVLCSIYTLNHFVQNDGGLSSDCCRRVLANDSNL